MTYKGIAQMLPPGRIVLGLCQNVSQAIHPRSLTGPVPRGPAPPAQSVQRTIRNVRIRTEMGVRESGQSTQVA